MEREINGVMGPLASVMQLMYHVDKGAELKGKVLDLPVDLCLHSHLCLRTLNQRTRSPTQMAELSFLNRVAKCSLKER